MNIDITWHTDQYAITINNYFQYQLTPTEFYLLFHLRHGEAVTYADLAYLIYGCSIDEKVRIMLDKHVDRARAKLRGSRISISCVLGYGYILLHDFPGLQVKNVVVQGIYEGGMYKEYVVEESMVVQSVFKERVVVDPVFGESVDIIWHIDDQRAMTINWHAGECAITINRGWAISLTPTEFCLLFPLRFGVLVPYAYLANEVCKRNPDKWVRIMYERNPDKKVRTMLDRHINGARGKMVGSGLYPYCVLGHGYVLLPELSVDASY